MTRVGETDLTAYALDEAGAEAASAIEAALNERPDWLAEVEATRDVARVLSTALSAEAATMGSRLSLPPERRQLLVAAAARVRAPRRIPKWAVVAAAVPLAAVAVVGSWHALRVAPRMLTKTRVGDHNTPPGPAVKPPALSREQHENLRSLGYASGPSDDDWRASGSFNTESYAHTTDNDFLAVVAHPLSTFAMDVDTASYANVRRFLGQGQRPPIDAVRIEEMVNYFAYDDEPPTNGDAFAARVEVGPAPWQPQHRLVRIGLKARQLEASSRPPVNLVFLVDVSGSMDVPEKLPLVQQAMRLLANRLEARDRMAVVVYAGAAGLVLPSVSGGKRSAIESAIDGLKAGGSTNGGQGIALAYDVAQRHFISGGVNRVVLATDGDFNVGVTDQGSLVRLVQEKAKQGVFLTALGFGRGNYKDSTLELLADKGNGNYAYIDTLAEARKALVEQMNATLVTVAKDAKVQVEFNPARVHSYRLIGYENRLLRAEEFADDAKDGGEVGSGHTVTALYEVVPAGARATAKDTLRYQTGRGVTGAAASGELLHVRVRYKDPDEDRSRLLEWPAGDGSAAIEETSADFRFAAAVAAFGMLLRESAHRGEATLDQVEELARAALGNDPGGYRNEFLRLVQQARPLLPAAQ